ncbi:hypothetical protein FLA_4756 [Filimonas lacunae]|nr:hypothetical protein FLA_4756 [Filimonas lacunae]
MCGVFTVTYEESDVRVVMLKAFLEIVFLVATTAIVTARQRSLLVIYVIKNIN